MLIEYDVKDGFSVCLLQNPFAARQVVVKWLAMQGSTQAAGKGLEHPFDEVMVVVAASTDVEVALHGCASLRLRGVYGADTRQSHSTRWCTGHMSQ